MILDNPFLFRYTVSYVGQSVEMTKFMLAHPQYRGHLSAELFRAGQRSSLAQEVLTQLGERRPSTRDNNRHVPRSHADAFRLAQHVRRLCAVCRSWNRRIVRDPRSWMLNEKAATLATRALAKAKVRRGRAQAHCLPPCTGPSQSVADLPG